MNKAIQYHVAIAMFALCVNAVLAGGAREHLKADGQVLSAAQTEHLEDASLTPAASPASGLPEILLIGDSIRIGYCGMVAEVLSGKAEVRWPKENCQNSQYILTSLARWRGLVASPKVVQFNCGHWDAAHFDGDGESLTSVEEYGRNVRKIILRIRRYWPETKIVFATTTPMNPSGATGRNNRTTDEIRLYNAEAARVAKSEGVEVNDLFAVTENWPASDYADYCHFNISAAKRLGNIVASRLAVGIGNAKCAATLSTTPDPWGVKPDSWQSQISLKQMKIRHDEGANVRK